MFLIEPFSTAGYSDWWEPWDRTNSVNILCVFILFLKFSLCHVSAGALPSKTELLIDPELDQELEKLWEHTVPQV